MYLYMGLFNFSILCNFSLRCSNYIYFRIIKYAVGTLIYFMNLISIGCKLKRYFAWWKRILFFNFPLIRVSGKHIFIYMLQLYVLNCGLALWFVSGLSETIFFQQRGKVSVSGWKASFTVKGWSLLVVLLRNFQVARN